MAKIKIPAARVRQGGLVLYATALKVKDLISQDFYSVETLDPEDNDDKGYQRLLNTARAKKLADYIVKGQDSQDAFLPTSVFLATDKSIGFIYSFGLNLTDGYVFINTFIGESSRQKGYGAEASVLLTCYLFNSFPLFKVYYEAFGYNNSSLSMMRTAGLHEEGCFRGHRFWEGEHHDVVRFAAYRDRLDRIRRLEKRFKGCKI